MTVSMQTIGRLVACLGLNPRRFIGPGRAKSAAREMQLSLDLGRITKGSERG